MLTPETFVRGDVPVEVTGADAVRSFIGLDAAEPAIGRPTAYVWQNPLLVSCAPGPSHPSDAAPIE